MPDSPTSPESPSGPSSPSSAGTPHSDGSPADTNEDLKAKMREALERKNGNRKGVAHPAGPKEKAHGSEVLGAGPKMHRRKAGGGGS